MTDVLRRNNVSVSGRGSDALIFGQGLGCDQRIWRHMLPAFLGTHRVITFDYVGSGGSDRAAYDSARYATLSGYAADVVDICSELDLRGAVFVGHSVSGMIGALASILEPARLTRLVMIASSPRYLNELPDYYGGFQRQDIERLLELMDQNFIGWATALANVATTRPELARELRDTWCDLDRSSARDFARATFYCDLRGELPRVQAPTLVVQCTDDDIAPLAVGEYTARRLPRGRLRVLDVSGHLPHVTNAPETSELIHDFLSRG